MLATPPPATVVERVLMAALENNLGQDLPSRRRTVRIAMMQLPSFDQPDCASFHFPVIRAPHWQNTRRGLDASALLVCLNTAHFLSDSTVSTIEYGLCIPFYSLLPLSFLLFLKVTLVCGRKFAGNFFKADTDLMRLVVQKAAAVALTGRLPAQTTLPPSVEASPSTSLKSKNGKDARHAQTHRRYWPPVTMCSGLLLCRSVSSFGGGKRGRNVIRVSLAKLLRLFNICLRSSFALTSSLPPSLSLRLPLPLHRSHV